jgi:rhamnosyltransferase
VTERSAESDKPVTGHQRAGVSLAVVVVRYKKAIRDMPAIRYAKAIESNSRNSTIRWIIVDNSPSGATMHDRAGLPDNSRYLWLGANRGLSKAYNAALTQLDESTTHICFLDQDTEGVGTYVQAILDQGDCGSDIVLPVVVSGSVILSPCRRTGPWYRPIRQRGAIPGPMSWINSGMVVSAQVFASTRFDERLFLDYVDHRFALDAQRAGASVDVRWELALEQDYSRDTDDVDSAYRRYMIFRADLRTFYGRSVAGRLWAIGLTLRRALVATKKYRTTRFLAAWTSGRRTADAAER